MPSTWRDEAFSSSWPHVSPFPFGPRPKPQHCNFISLCCLFSVLLGNSLPVRNFAALPPFLPPSPTPWQNYFPSPTSSYPSPLPPEFLLCYSSNPFLVSNMDSSGQVTTSAPDGHIEPRSSPGRSDLSGLYSLGRTLGRGHFAVVKLARHVNTRQLVAVKMIDKTKLDVMATSHLLQEVR